MPCCTMHKHTKEKKPKDHQDIPTIMKKTWKQIVENDNDFNNTTHLQKYVQIKKSAKFDNHHDLLTMQRKNIASTIAYDKMMMV